MISNLKVLDYTGDTRYQWDTAVLDAPETVLAKEKFDNLMGLGFAAFEIDSKGNGSQIKEFDPNAENILMMSALVGG